MWRPPHSDRQRYKVCSDTPMRRAAPATVLPPASTTSAPLSLLMTYLGVCFLWAMSSPSLGKDTNICPGPVSGGQVTLAVGKGVVSP